MENAPLVCDAVAPPVNSAPSLSNRRSGTPGCKVLPSFTVPLKTIGVKTTLAVGFTAVANESLPVEVEAVCGFWRLQLVKNKTKQINKGKRLVKNDFEMVVFVFMQN